MVNAHPRSRAAKEAEMTTQQMKPIAVRVLRDEDRSEVERLAGVDSAAVPSSSRMIGAEVGGRLVAAISLVDGAVIADPFQPTSGAVELLRLRSAQLGGAEGPRPGALRRVLAGLARGHAHAGLAGSPPGAGGQLLRL
jgi:hypothetical protein